jgi:hypothetical protein
MYNPEIYLQAELQYHRDHIRGQFGSGRLQRSGKPVRARRAPGKLVRRNRAAVSASR